jgi:hypothetical protein
MEELKRKQEEIEPFFWAPSDLLLGLLCLVSRGVRRLSEYAFPPSAPGFVWGEGKNSHGV